MSQYIGIILALISALFAALVAIFGKIGLKDIDSNTATSIRAVVMAVFLITIVIIQGKTNNISTIMRDHKAIAFIVLSGVAGALSWLFYFWALKLGKVSQIAPIDKLSVVFSTILAVLILKETISIKSAIGVIITTLGSILVALG